MRRPTLRSIMMLAFLVYFVATVITSPVGVSHLSHVGGFVCGLFPALLFLPHLRSQRFEAWMPVAGAAMTVAVFTALPTYFYEERFPKLGNCGGVDLSRYM
jgi:hypothetical protein